MHRLTNRLSCIIVLVVMMIVIFPTSSLQASTPSTPAVLSTISNVSFYPLVASGKTDIAVALCADLANFQLRSEQSNVFLSQIFVRSTKCPVAVSGSWRAVIGASPGECFTIYAFATETALAESDFMARATRYSICVTGLGILSTPQQQIVTAPTGAIDAPSSGSTVQGLIPVSGWALDAASGSGTGVDQVQVYYGATLLGTASYGQARADLAALYSDSRYANSGYNYQLDTAQLPNGTRTVQLRYHSTITNQWTSIDRSIVVNNPTVGTPVQQPITQPYTEWKVPYYWQGNPQWAGKKIGACANTIGNVGCALTSLAMIFKFYAVPIDPGALNTCLGNDACLMNWFSNNIVKCSNGKVSKAEWVDFSTQADLYVRLEQALKNGPVIMAISNNRGEGHFIVIISGSGNNPNNYRAHDPGRSGGENNKLKNVLDFWYSYNNYQFVPKSLRIFRGTPALATVNEVPQSPSQPSVSATMDGSASIYTNTDNGVVLELSEPTNASAETYIRVWTNQQPSTIWQPFSKYIQVPLASKIYVQFRDGIANPSAVLEAKVPTATIVNIQQNTQQIYLPSINR